PPDADLSGTLIVISNGELDPMIPKGMTERLAHQFRERDAEVVELPHPGGHQLWAPLFPKIRSLIARSA
ncbi:MAG: phospholipase/carboxylesterase, partial [Nocardioidaceae bacterium]|nr:phospholipase/carboxylesterase [Nocardioidaceae bacterium]